MLLSLSSLLKWMKKKCYVLAIIVLFAIIQYRFWTIGEDEIITPSSSFRKKNSNVLRRSTTSLSSSSQTTTSTPATSITAITAAFRNGSYYKYRHNPVPGNQAGSPLSSSDECRYYLAESAIPGGSGLGLFAGIGHLPGDLVGMTDVCIYAMNPPRRGPFHSHSWGQDVFFGQFEGKSPRAACEGFATLYNSMPQGTYNSKLIPLRKPTNGGLHRDYSPGAGAITHYYGITSVATRTIPAGYEFTIDYGDYKYDPNTAEYKAPKRSPSWLRQHGMCIDNLNIQQSKDPEMGRGAFATRYLPMGTTVSPAPLQIFRNRTDFQKGVPESLFVNYCFQPKGTDMLLFPYAPAVNLINHNHQNPNVGLRWSKSYMHHEEWLALDSHSLGHTTYPGGLILDFVALRDIEPNEEIFLDYGQSWEQAWWEHMKTWQPFYPASSLDESSSYVYPAEIDETAPIRTLEEREVSPYPSNLATVCHTSNGWFRDRNASNLRVTWEEPQHPWPEGLCLCHILKREEGENGEDVYTVALDFEGTYKYNASLPLQHPLEDHMFVDEKVPRHAIRFVDKPYTSDQHLPNSFRHPIEFPEELIPDAWRSGDF